MKPGCRVPLCYSRAAPNERSNVGTSTRFLGEEYESPGRTVTESDLVIFAGLTGDYNVLHTDAEFMKQLHLRRAHRPRPPLPRHPVRLFNRAATAYATLWLAGLRWKFKAPVKIGDTIRLRAKVAAKKDLRASPTGSRDDRAHHRQPARRGGPAGETDLIVEKRRWREGHVALRGCIEVDKIRETPAITITETPTYSLISQSLDAELRSVAAADVLQPYSPSPYRQAGRWRY